MPGSSANNILCAHQGEILSKEILEYLVAGQSFGIDDVVWDDSKLTIPEDFISKWNTDVDPVTIEELTSRKAFGTGIFDALMESVHNHLKVEYDSGRIPGSEYAKTYTALTEAALAHAVQFALQKNQAYFQGILAQAQAITAGIQAQIAAITAKIQFAKIKADALGAAATYAATTMKLATEDAQQAMLCHQARLLDPDRTDGSNIDYQIKQEQLRQTKYQADGLDPNHTAGTGTNIDYLLKDAQLRTAQKNMEHVDNQMEVEDKQKDLYVQQKLSYQYHSEKEAADLFANTYVAMKSVDEGLAIPKAFSGASINEVMQALKVNVGLGEDSTNKDHYIIGEGQNRHEYNNVSDLPSAGTEANLAYLQYGVLSTSEDEGSSSSGSGSSSSSGSGSNSGSSGSGSNNSGTSDADGGDYTGDNQSAASGEGGNDPSNDDPWSGNEEPGEHGGWANEGGFDVGDGSSDENSGNG